MKTRKNRILTFSRFRARAADALPRRLEALYRRPRRAPSARVTHYAAIERGREA